MYKRVSRIASKSSLSASEKGHAAVAAMRSFGNDDTASILQVKDKLKKVKFSDSKHELQEKADQLANPDELRKNFSHLQAVFKVGQEASTSMHKKNEALGMSLPAQAQSENCLDQLSIQLYLLCELDHFRDTSKKVKSDSVRAMISVGGVLLEWGNKDLVEPEFNSINPRNRLVFHADVYFQATSCLQAEIRMPELLSTQSEEFAHCFETVATRMKAINNLIEVISKYNRYYYYHSVSRNSITFVQDCLKALDIKTHSTIAKQLKEQAKQLLQRNLNVPHTFENHKELDDLVEGRRQSGELEGMSTDDLDYLVCMYHQHHDGRDCPDCKMADLQRMIKDRLSKCSFKVNQRAVSKYCKQTENNIHIPFIGPVAVIVCDHNGIHHTLHDHGITLNIPKGAIPKGQTVHIEIAVSLYGPFTFPSDTRPISPILWICPHEDINFQVPIQVNIPHFLTGLTPQELVQMGVRFAKANHLQQPGTNFKFKSCTEQTKFSYIPGKKQACGTLESCYLCIIAKQCPKVARNIGFLFSRFDEKLSSVYAVTYCVSFFLPTCLKVLDELYPDRVCVRKKHSEFKFKQCDGQESHLKVDIPNPFSEKYLAYTHPKHSKIMMSQVDFWTNCYNLDDMKLRHRLKLYPPTVKVEWTPTGSPYACCAIPITVTGCDNDLNNDIILPFAALIGSIAASSNGHTQSNALTERYHFKICQYLKHMDEYEIIRLGQALGLLRSKLKKMRILPDDMVDAWLKQSAHVLETSGQPTWDSLCNALRQIDQNGIAATIHDDDKAL